jgi:cytochrome c oxidase assembly factor CtaG
VDPQLTDRRPWRPWRLRRLWRPWLAAAGAALVVVCLVPPLSVLARRYLFVESAQFCVFAMAAPALVVLGTPWRLFPRGGPDLVAPPRGPDSLAGPLAEAGPLRRRQLILRRPSFAAALGYLIAWVVVCLFWRLPPVLDQLARHPVLAVAEAVTLCAAGIGLWLQLARSRPSAPPLGRPQRASAAALAMWSIWVIAYVLGFARGSVVQGYDGGGSHLLTVDDQEISAALLWAAAAVSFLPVVFTAALTWLADGSENAEEPVGGGSGSAVRGWGPRTRERRRRPAR